MTEIVIQKRAELKKIETAQLYDQLSHAIGLTASAIQTVAVIWDELVSRGEDLSHIKFALKDFMHDVANGNLIPEAVAQLAGSVRTLKLVSDLPVKEQKRLIDGDEIDILMPDETVEKKRITELSWPEAARVFASGHILNIKEQKMKKARIGSRKKRPETRGRPVRIVVDPEHGTIKIGKASIPLENILAELRSAGVIK